MLLFRQILVSTLVLGIGAVSLMGCGQQGPLYLPTDPAATRRATSPETQPLLHSVKPTPTAPSTPASTPAPP